MRSSLFARLLLILALLSAQLGGLTHALAHAMERQAQGTDQSLPHDKHCDQCEAYAQIGSALASGSIGFTASENLEALHQCASGSTASQPFTAFAARAPPSI